MNLTIKRLIFGCLSIVALWQLSACDNKSATPPSPTATTPVKITDFDKNVGWIHGNCLAIKHANLLSGTMIAVISLDSQQTVLTVPVVGPGSAEAGCPALLEDRIKQNTQNARSFYLLSLPPADPERLAVGILRNNLPMSNEITTFTADLDGDGKNDSVSSCDTSEGMKFSLWSGAVTTGKLLWSDYYYLGYDLKPTCPP